MFRSTIVVSLAVAMLATPKMSTGNQPGEGIVIVLNKSGASASLLNRQTGKEFARVQTGIGPHEVAVSPDGKTAVIADYGEREPGSTLTVIDLQAYKVKNKIDLQRYHRPHGIVFMPDGQRVVVTAEREQSLLVVDVTAGDVQQAIGTTQDISHMVATTPRADRAFVANIRSGSVSVVDLNSGELIKVIPTADGAEGIDVSPDGNEVWVSNRAADSLTVIDADKLTVKETIECGKFPIRVKFTPGGEHVLVSCAQSGDVAVFDAKSRKEIKRVKMDVQRVEVEGRLFSDRFGESPVPVGILIPPDGKQAYVANTNADLVTVIDLDTWKITGRLTAGREPDGLGYSSLKPIED